MLLEHVLLALVATKRAVFCWQCFSDLGLVLIVYLRCLYQCRQFNWHRMVPFEVGLRQLAHLCLFWLSPVCAICTFLLSARPLNQRVHKA